MTMSEWWCEYEQHAPATDTRYAGKLTAGAVDEILDFLDERAAADGIAGTQSTDRT